MIRNGLRWRAASAAYGPAKTIGNRVIRGNRPGVSDKIVAAFSALSAQGGKPDRVMIDATHRTAHRTTAGRLEKGLFPDVSGAAKAV